MWVAVNEADIGNIIPGKPVTFTVDAFPGRTFHGTVGKVRFNAQMTQNVVTYTVEVETDNSDGKLLPYRRPTSVKVTRLHNVMLVPNEALRYEPGTRIDPPMPAPAWADWHKSRRRPVRVDGAGRAVPTPRAAPGRGRHRHARPLTIAHAHTTAARMTRPSPWTRGRVWVADADPPVRAADKRARRADRSTCTEIQSDKLSDGTRTGRHGGEIRPAAATGAGTATHSSRRSTTRRP